MLLDQPRADVAEVEEENRGGRMRMDRRIAKQNPKVVVEAMGMCAHIRAWSGASCDGEITTRSLESTTQQSRRTKEQRFCLVGETL